MALQFNNLFVSITTIFILFANFNNAQLAKCPGNKKKCYCPTATQPNQTCIFTCSDAGSCQSKTLFCRSGDPCQINCESTNSCSSNLIIEASTATHVNLICNGQDSCQSSNTLYCGTGNCKISCNTNSTCQSFGTVHINYNSTQSFQCTGNCPNTLPQSFGPTISPTTTPTISRTYIPTYMPTHTPTFLPTHTPTISPTYMPTHTPTISPTYMPTHTPTISPTYMPTHTPTISPTYMPTHTPTTSTTQTTNIESTQAYISTTIYTVQSTSIETVATIATDDTLTSKGTISTDNIEIISINPTDTIKIYMDEQFIHNKNNNIFTVGNIIVCTVAFLSICCIGIILYNVIKKRRRANKLKRIFGFDPSQINIEIEPQTPKPTNENTHKESVSEFVMTVVATAGT
eukprot:368667_1